MAAHAPRALIADDEGFLRTELRKHLQGIWPELQVVAMAEDGIEALRRFDEHRPEVVFLDIEMPGLNGLEVARQVAAHTHVVFVTAYDEHALAAFDHGAVDYLLKPFEVARLALAVSRLRQRLGRAVPALESAIDLLTANRAPPSFLRWINASAGRDVRVITIDEVLFFQADTRYTRVVTRKGESLIRLSLRELQQQLDPAVFWPIHRSTIVNANAIEKVVRDMRGGLRLELRQFGERLAVSEAHAHLFRQM